MFKIQESSSLNLTGRVFMVTGANAGIGREITTYLAKKMATVYMVCRSEGKAKAAKEEVVAQTSNPNVHVLVCDCSVGADVRKMWSDFMTHRYQVISQGEELREALATADTFVSPVRLDALVCNAGALSNEKTLTSEGVETTFAAHLLFGTYLLGELAMPTLAKTPGSRFIAVSSGGMYNTKFPEWEDATATGNAAYDGQFAYAYAKRGQVLLCERWSKLHPTVKVVSCHPGWTDTGGVDAAYGSNKSYLEPLRSLWEGSEGIVWLCVAPVDQIEGGGFYLGKCIEM
jgi:dehydrogenase/reductase SDR family member 12